MLSGTVQRRDQTVLLRPQPVRDRSSVQGVVRVQDGATTEPPWLNWKFVSSDDRGDAAIKHQDRRNYVCLSLEIF